MDPAGHGLLVKWNKFQKCYKNRMIRIKLFLPRVGDHPDVTLGGVVFQWNPALKEQKSEDLVMPVIFPSEIVRMYKELNDA